MCVVDACLLFFSPFALMTRINLSVDQAVRLVPPSETYVCTERRAEKTGQTVRCMRCCHQNETIWVRHAVSIADLERRVAVVGHFSQPTHKEARRRTPSGSRRHDEIERERL
ncbi:uncharacterized protein BKA78DRAFT_325780 [Phyllosticta capitalensis]|uniref:uncharacterized protein n=1 Tax=Phyllosticta capitalensis TaxID=121624 RepID=UPI003130BFD8